MGVGSRRRAMLKKCQAISDRYAIKRLKLKLRHLKRVKKKSRKNKKSGR